MRNGTHFRLQNSLLPSKNVNAGRHELGWRQFCKTEGRPQSCPKLGGRGKMCDCKTWPHGLFFRFVGIKVDDKTREVGGEVIDFLIDDLGFNVDWQLKVRYVVKDSQSGTILYDANKETQRRTAKLINVFAGLNETIKSNIDELFKDESFMNAIKPAP